MMTHTRACHSFPAIFAAFIIALLASCSHVETIPKVRILPNASGLAVSEFRAHGPSSILGSGPPTMPAGVSATVERIRPLHNQEARYFIKASGRLRVVSVERSAKDASAANLQAWRSLLAAKDPTSPEVRQTLAKQQLSEMPWMNAGRVFHAKLRHHRFPWGDALMFITTYVQGPTGGPVNNDSLVLVVQGLTTDGRYAVNGHFELHHPSLPDTSEDNPPSTKVYLAIDDRDPSENWLDNQPDDSFAPSLKHYEALLAALDIQKGQPLPIAEPAAPPPSNPASPR